jgi:zinc protease
MCTKFSRGISNKNIIVDSMTKLFFGIIALVVSAAAQAALPIQHWQSVSGAKVYFVENHDLPILDVSVNVAAGSSFDTPE